MKHLLLHPRVAASCAATLLCLANASAAPRGFGINAEGQLFSFDLNRPTQVTVIGSGVNGNVKGIDFRPGTDSLYAVEVNAQSAQLYTLDPGTGARTPVGQGFANEGTVAGIPYSLNPSATYGFDFNPTTLQNDGSVRIRLVNSAGVDLRLDSDLGTVAAVDGSLAYSGGSPANSNVTASAYTNSNTSRPGGQGAGTQLYYLETANDNLVTITAPASPNDGIFTTVGALGADLDATASFDIFTANAQNKAYATVRAGGSATGTLHLVNLQTGAASGSLGAFPDGFAPVNGFAIGNAPETPLPANVRGYAYAGNGQLFSFPLDNPAAATPIGGAGNSDVKGLDFRPGTNVLYAFDVSATGARLFTVNLATGARTPVGPAFAVSGSSPGNYALNSNGIYGFDFNPATLQADGSIRIRLVSNQGQDLRLNANTGAIAAVDGTLGYGDGTAANAGITAAAYTNSDTARSAGTGAPTRLFYIDSLNNNLVSIVPPADPNAGQFSLVGALGVDLPNPVNFDIFTGPDGTNYGFITVSGEAGATLHRVDLVTGQAGPAIGTFPANLVPSRGFAIGREPSTPAADRVPPTVRITNPARPSRVVAQPRFRVAGVARDNVGVARVDVRLNGRLIRVPIRGARWTRLVPLRPGRNAVRVFAIDRAGNRSRPDAALLFRRPPVR